MGSNRTLDQFRYGAFLSYTETDGIDSLNDTVDFNADEDAYENLNANLSFGYSWHNDADLSFNYFFVDAESDYDSQWSPNTQPYSESGLEVASIKVFIPVSEQYSSSFSLGNSVDKNENFDRQLPNTSAGEFETIKNTLYWQNDLQLSKQFLLTLGLDYYHDNVNVPTVYDVNTNSNIAGFAQLQFDWHVFDLQFGIRHDDNDNYGEYTNSSFAFGFLLNSQHKLYASFSEGFKGPTFNDLYWPASGSSEGNPELLPEQSENIELGLRAQYEAYYWEANAYKNRVENLIDWAPGTDSVWRPTNLTDVTLQGAEFSFGADYNSWYWESSLSALSAKDKETGERLQSRARYTAILTAGHHVGSFDYGLNLKRQGEREDGDTDIGGYTLIDLFTHIQISPELKLSFKINNALDESYQLNSSYNQDRVNGSVRIEFSF